MKIALTFVVAGCLHLRQASAVADDPKPEVEIHSVDGKSPVADDEIPSYE